MKEDSEGLPRIALTVGDPAGIGPEICELAISSTDGLVPILFGPANVVEPIGARLRVEARSGPHFDGPRARASEASGSCALAALHDAIEAAKRGEVDALCTAPLNKEALALAGSQDRGHTEILARELASGPTAMAFFSERLTTALVTTHLPLRDAIESLSVDRIVEVATLLSAALSARAVAGLQTKPRLALAALNPHAGENGLLGDEEIEILAPAVASARAAGVDLTGPYPADTLFRRAADREFDGVVSLYHDQALIALKLLGVGTATNVTLGLRVPRTSPDHGTAFDRIGGGEAIDGRGMIRALEWARVLAAGPRPTS